VRRLLRRFVLCLRCTHKHTHTFMPDFSLILTIPRPHPVAAGTRRRDRGGGRRPRGEMS
jgi:hypothetical protein